MATLQLVKEIKTKSDSDFRAVTELNALTNEADKKYIKDILTQIKDIFTKKNYKNILDNINNNRSSQLFTSSKFDKFFNFLN